MAGARARLRYGITLDGVHNFHPFEYLKKKRKKSKIFVLQAACISNLIGVYGTIFNEFIWTFNSISNGHTKRFFVHRRAVFCCCFFFFFWFLFFVLSFFFAGSIQRWRHTKYSRVLVVCLFGSYIKYISLDFLFHLVFVSVSIEYLAVSVQLQYSEIQVFVDLNWFSAVSKYLSEKMEIS